MKKVLMAAIGLMMAASANAQYLNDPDTPFSKDKWYVGASASGLDLSWHKSIDWKFNLDLKGGYLFIDNWMVTGRVSWEAQTDMPSVFKGGAGIRYYFDSCGIYAGLSGNYLTCDDWNDFRPEVNVGYAYFLTGKLTIEPEVYYEYSTDHHDNSGFGFRLGLGLYF